MNNSEGYLKGETCNRDGCKGVIQEHHTDGGCSCHINPPCSYCETSREYCPECNWDGYEEQQEANKESLKVYSSNAEYYKKQYEIAQEQRDAFYKKYYGTEEVTEFDYRKENHTHFSMRILGFYPKGFDLSKEMDKIRGTFGGRFVRKTDTRFEYIAYTD